MPRSYFSQIGFCASIVLYFEENSDATKGHKPSKEKCFVTSFAILGLEMKVEQFAKSGLANAILE